MDGLRIQSSNKSIIDVEFSNDIGLYLKGLLTNLQIAESALNIFSLTLGSLVKLRETMTSWTPVSSMKWIPNGNPVTYLGCQVGNDLQPENLNRPLLPSSRKKLLYWNNQKTFSSMKNYRGQLHLVSINMVYNLDIVF